MKAVVRAKFRVTGIMHHDGGYKNLNMSAVYGTSGENKDFNDATPSGNFNMSISPKTKAADMFHPGDEFYLDFTPCNPNKIETVAQNDNGNVVDPAT